MQNQIEATGRFSTPNAARYMAQLCKHFAHKVPVSIEGDRAEVVFPMGTADLLADGTALTARVQAPDQEGLARLRAVIDDHLKRFAFREEFEAMDWDGAAR